MIFVVGSLVVVAVKKQVPLRIPWIAERISVGPCSGPSTRVKRLGFPVALGFVLPPALFSPVSAPGDLPTGRSSVPFAEILTNKCSIAPLSGPCPSTDTAGNLRSTLLDSFLLLPAGIYTVLSITSCSAWPSVLSSCWRVSQLNRTVPTY